MFLRFSVDYVGPVLNLKYQTLVKQEYQTNRVKQPTYLPVFLPPFRQAQCEQLVSLVSVYLDINMAFESGGCQTFRSMKR